MTWKHKWNHTWQEILTARNLYLNVDLLLPCSHNASLGRIIHALHFLPTPAPPTLPRLSGEERGVAGEWRKCILYSSLLQPSPQALSQCLMHCIEATSSCPPLFLRESQTFQITFVVYSKNKREVRTYPGCQVFLTPLRLSQNPE